MAKIWVYILISILTVLSSFTWASTDRLDVITLQDLHKNLNYPKVLKGWEGDDPCSEFWTGVECLGTSVVHLKIQGLNLTGCLGRLLYNLRSLRKLDVSSNNLVGKIPDDLPPNVVYINMAFNYLSQNIPHSLMEMKRLQILNLSHNLLSGPIGNVFLGLDNLQVVDLSYNYFIGDLPSSFASLRSLRRVNLSHNFLSGPIYNVLEGFSNIRQMDLSHNLLARGAFPNTTRVTRLRNAPVRVYLTKKQSVSLILLMPVVTTVLEVLFVLALRWSCTNLLKQTLSTNPNQQSTELHFSILTEPLSTPLPDQSTSTSPTELVTPQSTYASHSSILTEPPSNLSDQSPATNPAELATLQSTYELRSSIPNEPLSTPPPDQSPPTELATTPSSEITLSMNHAEPSSSPETPSPSSTDSVLQSAPPSQEPTANPPEQPRKWDNKLKGFVVLMLASNIWLTSLAAAFQTKLQNGVVFAAKLQNGAGFALAAYILTCFSALLLASSFGVLIFLDGIRVLWEMEPFFTVLNFLFVGAQVLLFTLEIITGQGPAMNKIFFPVLTASLDALLKWFTYKQSTKNSTPP